MKSLRSDDTRLEILNRIAQVSPADPARWGRMTSHEMLCHLRDSYELALGERQASPADNWFLRTMGKPISLWVPVHWVKNYPTRPEVDQRKGGSRPVEFTADTKSLQATVIVFCEMEQPRAAHPMFGPMNLAEWRRWGYLHADHHLRQFGR
jgi:hypothetical protein